MAAAAESRRRDRRALPTGRWGVCENGGLSLGTWVLLAVAQGKLAVFAHTSLTGGRSPPVLSSAFARSYHIDPSPMSLDATPKTAFLLRSIFQLVFFFLSNITSKGVSLYA